MSASPSTASRASDGTGVDGASCRAGSAAAAVAAAPPFCRALFCNADATCYDISKVADVNFHLDMQLYMEIRGLSLAQASAAGH